jgi:serine/threonine protein kinase/tetratricopeptide (TPR) repeat protein
MIGQTISHYKILDKLGEGGMGVVYKAHDTKLDRVVALKFLPRYTASDAAEKERFFHEARAAATLNHPNITTIYEVDEFETQAYIAMEFVEGKTLKRLVETEAVPLKKVLDLAIQTCDGLAAAAEKGVIHRDIKSDNIMVTPKGQIKIMDFGLAKLKGASKLTRTGSTLGTAAYMSPEQAMGEEVDQRSDIFSFGVVLYELLAGKLPFRGEHQAAIAYSIVNEEPDPVARYNDKISPEIERIVSKALAKDKDERYQHIDDLMADLRRERKNLEYARTGYLRTPVAPATPRPAEPAPPPAEVLKPKRNILKILIPVSAVAVVAVLFFLFNPFRTTVAPEETAAASGNSLAVMYFQNIPDPEDKQHTGDMLADLLITALSQTGGLEVLSRERLYDIQKEFGQGEAKAIDPSTATKVAQRAGVSTMLLGTILQQEPELAVTARLIDVKSGRILSSQRVTGFSIKQIFALVDTLALLVRNDLKVSAAVASEAKSVAEVTTSSPEAYRSYIEGVELNNRFYPAEARAALNHAVELDSNFAMAYFELSNISLDPADDATRGKTLEQAWKLSNRTTEKERLQIEAAYVSRVERNPSKAAEILEKLVEKYPREYNAYEGLSRVYGQMMLHEKVLELYQTAVKYNPSEKNLWNSLAYTYAGLNRRRESIEAVDNYLKLAPAEPNPYDSKGELYFVFGDRDSASHWFQKAVTFRTDFATTEKLGFDALLRQDYSSAEKYFQQFGSTPDKFQKLSAELDLSLIPIHRGELREAQRRLIAYSSSHEIQNDQGLLLGTYSPLILLSYEMRNNTALLEYAKKNSLERKKNPADNFYGRDVLALAYAVSGDSRTSSKIMSQLKGDLDRNLPQQQVRYDYALGLLAFEEGKYNVAVEQFRKSLGRVLPNHAPQFHYGVSLLKTGNLREAVEELQRVTWWYPISLPPISLFFLPTSQYWPIASVKALYWLGVAYEQLGQKEKAVGEFEKFLEIWKTADFDSPELKDARARVARLKGMAAK